MLCVAFLLFPQLAFAADFGCFPLRLMPEIVLRPQFRISLPLCALLFIAMSLLIHFPLGFFVRALRATHDNRRREENGARNTDAETFQEIRHDQPTLKRKLATKRYSTPNLALLETQH